MSILLPRYEFTRSANLSEEEKQAISQCLESQQIERPQNPLTVSIDPIMKFNEIIDNPMELAEQRFGYDLKLRFPASVKVHELEEFVKMREVSEGFGGQHVMPQNLIMLVNNDKVTYNFGHELMHALCGWRYNVKREDNSSFTVNGIFYGYHIYKRKKLFNGLNEFVTESANIEAMDLYERRTGVNMLGDGIGYYIGVILLDGLVEEASRRLKIPAINLRNRLYRGYFESNHGKLKFLHEAYGSKGLRFLMIFDSYLIKESIIKSWLSLEKTDIFDKINAYEEGKPIEILGGIEVQNSEVLR